MGLSEVSNAFKVKIKQFSDKVESNSFVQFVKKKETQFAKQVDRIPKPLMLAMHATPFVNIAASYFKEKGLKARLPELDAHINAEHNYKALNKEVTGLVKQQQSYKEAIANMKSSRAALEHSPATPGIKGNLSRRIAKWKCSDSKLKELEDGEMKISKKLEKLSPLYDAAKEERTTAQENLNAVNTNGEVAAIEKERKHLKYAYRVGIGILTAATVAAIALAAFSVIPTAVGLVAAASLGVSIGIHVALDKSAKWKHQGNVTLQGAEAAS